MTHTSFRGGRKAGEPGIQKLLIEFPGSSLRDAPE
jgi:hypothetical protein